MIDITAELERRIPPELACTLCHVFTPHTTAAITVNENADPDVRYDLLMKLEALIPRHEVYYQHGEGNSDAHLKASLFGFCQLLPVRRGRLALGTWQGVYFCEFDGPRTRQVELRFLPATE